MSPKARQESLEDNGLDEMEVNEKTMDTVVDEVEEEEDTEDDEDEDDDDDDFFASLTPEQIRLIREKQEALKNKYTSYAQKQETEYVSELVSGFGLSEDEAKVALECCDGNEIECKRRLVEEEDFIEVVKDTLLTKRTTGTRKSPRKERKKSEPKATTRSYDPQAKVKIEINADATWDDIENAATGKRKIKIDSALGDLEDVIRLQSEKSKKKKAKAGYKLSGEKRARNLRLSDALALLKEQKQEDNEKQTKVKASPKKKQVETSDLAPEDQVTFDGVTYKKADLETLGWSEARIKSFLSINSNPNSYYYRFNAPGEEQKTGGWLKEEIDDFMDAIKDGCNYRWGEFSMRFPGRVGYQCSNFYRKLIEDGVIKDPNYVYVEGKLKFLGKDGKRFSRKQEEAERKLRAKEERERRKAQKRLEGSSSSDEAPSRKRKQSKAAKKKGKRKRGSDIIRADDCESSEEESASESEAEDRGVELIKGLKCPMTMSSVKNPTLSPYGHIMGYDTWLKILNKAPRNQCPFTKQKLTRRMLVKLDEENVFDYTEEIKRVYPEFTEEKVVKSS